MRGKENLAGTLATPVNGALYDGEPGRNRTCDPRIKSALLYQLSYGPTFLIYHRKNTDPVALTADREHRNRWIYRHLFDPHTWTPAADFTR